MCTHNPSHSPSPWATSTYKGEDRSPCSLENLGGVDGDEGGTEGSQLCHQGAGVRQTRTTAEQPGCPPQTHNHVSQKPLVPKGPSGLGRARGVSEVTQYVHDRVGARTHTSGLFLPPAPPTSEAMASRPSLSRAVLRVEGCKAPLELGLLHPRCCDNNPTLPTFSNAPPLEGGDVIFIARHRTSLCSQHSPLSKYRAGLAGPGLTFYFRYSSRIPDLWAEIMVTAFPVGAAPPRPKKGSPEAEASPLLSHRLGLNSQLPS